MDRFLARFEGARLTPRGIAFLLVGIAAVLVAYAAGWPALLPVGLFLGGAVAAALASVVVAPPALAVSRRIDPAITEQRREVQVRLSVRGAAGGTVDWVERLPSTAAAIGPVSGRLRLRASAALLEYRVAARRRGSVPLGPFGVVRTDPLGLAVTRRDVGGSDALVVLPRLHPVVLPELVTRTDPDSTASSAFGPVGDQRDVVAREYRAGDPIRSVDWRATAHRGELMVRTEAAASASSTALALETRSDAWHDDGVFEWAVEYTASMAAALGERRAVVRFTGDRRAPVTEDATGALVALALVKRSAGAARPPELAARLAVAGVRVIHVVTGTGSVGDLVRLPRLPHGAIGLVSVVGAQSAPPVPPGWRAVAVNPSRPVSEARFDG